MSEWERAGERAQETAWSLLKDKLDAQRQAMVPQGDMQYSG